MKKLTEFQFHFDGAYVKTVDSDNFFIKNVSIEVLFKLQIIFNWESVDELKNIQNK